MRIIPNGVDERFAHGDPGLFRRAHGVEDFILTVGHTGHERKNVLRLIRALGEIDCPAVIVGRIMDNAYGAACRAEAAKHRHIMLLERLENDSAMLASAYAACNVFALPSLFETPGIAALEAGLAGAKVAITKFGGTKEYFGALADYVDPRSVASIREGITKALERRKDDLLSQHIRKSFLWPKIAGLTADAYRAVLDGTL
jgi:glycosyltransferase involved in cell wall biosynthesis